MFRMVKILAILFTAKYLVILNCNSCFMLQEYCLLEKMETVYVFIRSAHILRSNFIVFIVISVHVCN